jgi:hypothetical protein
LNEQKEVDPQSVIKEQFGHLRVSGKQYPLPLPDELKPWYCYASGYGHSLAVLLKSRLATHQFPQQTLELAPVKTVLRGYEMQDGYIMANLSYTPQTGLRVPPEDIEW